MTRRSKRTILKDKELRFLPKRPFRLKLMPSDPDRELNSSDSKLALMLEKNSRQEVVVAVEVAVDVEAVLKAKDAEKTRANVEVERLSP